MISYSKYKLLKEADAPVPAPPGGAPPPAADIGSPPSGPGPDIGGPPPGFSGGPPMGGMGGGSPPSMDLGGMGGMGMGGPTGSASGLKPEGIKSTNVWDVLEKILSNSSNSKEDKKSK